jgi:hypothetical protein
MQFSLLKMRSSIPLHECAREAAAQPSLIYTGVPRRYCLIILLAPKPSLSQPPFNPLGINGNLAASLWSTSITQSGFSLTHR